MSGAATTQEVRAGWQKFSSWKRVPSSGAEDSGAEFDAWLAAVIAAARAEGAAVEREACAQVAEGFQDAPAGANTLGQVTYNRTPRFPFEGPRIAAAIRARSGDGDPHERST